MEEEFLEYHTANLWRSLYTQICIESRNNDFTAVEALKPENKHLNRYRDVYPYDHSRVGVEGVPSTDYVNASLVKVEAVARSYILTQGPLAATTSHFWCLTWEQQSKAVIMLNRVMEKGTLKCHQYWPTGQGDCLTFDDVGLKVENIEVTPGEHYNISTLRLTNTVTEEWRDVLHFHYTTWPDFGVPTCPDTFLEFLGAVRESGSLDSNVGPALVHCSAGIGRSGTFCLVDSCLLEAQTAGPHQVNIKQRLLDMRTYRMNLVQTEDQLKFSYQSIIEGARQLGLISLAPPYSTEVAVSECSETESEEDAPPPLPPPRTESLRRNSSQDLQQQQDEVVVNGEAGVAVGTAAEAGAGAGAGRDSGTSSGSSAEHSPNKCILTSNKLEERKKEMELRRRKKEEEKHSSEDKSREVESGWDWSARLEFWQETLLPFSVGLAMFAAGGYFYFRD